MWFKKKEKKKVDVNRYSITPIIDTGVKWYKAEHGWSFGAIGVRDIVIATEYYKRRADAVKWLEKRIADVGEKKND